MLALLQNIRYAARSTARGGAHTILAVTMLALGIGVNTAMFSVIDAVLLREAPYRDSDRLITVRQKFPQIGDVSLNVIPSWRKLQWPSKTTQGPAIHATVWLAIAIDWPTLSAAAHSCRWPSTTCWRTTKAARRERALFSQDLGFVVLAWLIVAVMLAAIFGISNWRRHHTD